MYSILQHTHSGLRWLVLIFLALAIIAAFQGKGSAKFWIENKKKALFALMFTHIQIVLGFIMYFISPKVIFDGSSMKDAVSRFYLVEHLTGMLIAAILITIGYSKAKRNVELSAKSIFTYYLAGLIVILISIPWPFRNLGGGWF
jgi:heme A synthase